MNTIKTILIVITITLVGYLTYTYFSKPTPTTNEISNNTSGSAIDLSSKNLDQIPSWVFDSKNTTKLDVSENKLTGSIQGEIRFLSNLKELYLNDNNMTGLPAEIGQLSKLEILDVSNNKLTGLPNELGNLKNLKKFNISGNQYSQQDLDGILKSLPSTVEVIK